MSAVLGTVMAILGGVVTPASATGNTTLNTSSFFDGVQAGSWSVVGTSTSDVIGAVVGDPNSAPYHNGTSVTYPCLTASPYVSGSTSIPNCNMPTFAQTGVAGGASSSYQDTDPASPVPGTASGVLRLTTDDGSVTGSGDSGQVGAVFYSTSFPTSSGLDINFNSYQWATGQDAVAADGIGFTLAAVNPANPQPPSAAGPAGGDLGYSSDQLGFNSGHLAAGHSGLPDGYLGFGLDVFGNYANPDYQGSNCSDTALGLAPQNTYAQQVSVKGPGNGTQGYCLLDSTTEAPAGGGTTTNTGANLSGSVTAPSTTDWGGSNPNVSLDFNHAANDLPAKRPSPVQTEVLINTSGTAESMTLAACSSYQVPADSFGVCTIPIQTSNGHALSGGFAGESTFITDTLPNGTGIIPSGWLGTGGVPKQLEFGWTASTGSSVELHDVNNFAATTSNGAIPVYALTNTDSASGNFTNNARPTFTLTPSLASANGAGPEVDAATLTDTFPAGVDLTNAIVQSATDSSNNSWNCSISGQVLTCTILASAESGSQFAAGASLPIVKVYNARVTTSSGSLQSAAEISSNDGLAATANDTGTVSAGIPTTTLVSLSPSSPVYGQPVTYSATVTPTSGGPTVDGGTVNFSIGGALVSGCSAVAIVTSGSTSTATCNTTQTYNSLGAQPAVTGTYSGDATYGGSTDTEHATTTIAPTTTTVSNTPSSPTVGQPVTYKATVAPTSGGTTVDGGTVNFTIGGTSITGCGAVAIVTSGSTSTATCGTTETYNTLGVQAAVTGTYSGDTNYQTSNGNHAVTTTIAPTTTAVSNTPGSPVVGNAVTYKATVTPVNGGTTVDGGTVNFSIGGTSITGCSAVAIVTSGSTSTATCGTTETYNTSGPQATVTATYSGDTNYQTSNGTDQVTVAAGIAPTTTSVSNTPGSPVVGNAVTYKATVAPTSGGTTVDGGTVNFTIGGTSISGCGAVAIVTSGSTSTATCGTAQTYNSTGSQPTVTATYSGDSNYQTSNGTDQVTVSAAGNAITLQATATPSSSLHGTNVVLTATGLPTPATGTITFTTNGTTLCSYTIGIASSCGTVQPVGAYQVTATYSGDTTYPSASTTTLFIVSSLPSSIVAKATPSSSPVGTIVTLSATGVPTGATGTVTFTATDGSTLCRYIVGNATSCATSASLVAGTYPVLAVYSGDANNASADAATSFVLTPVIPGSSGPQTKGGKTYKDTLTGNLPIPTGTGPFTYTITAQPPSNEGFCSVDSTTGTVTFTRAAGFSGSVQCGYTVTGPTGTTVSTGQYDVLAEPMVSGTSAVTAKGVPISVSLPRGVGRGPLTYRLLSGPPAADGHYSFDKNGQVTFSPAPDFTGQVSFRYQVRDVHGNLSLPATTTIHVGASGIVIPDAHTGEPWSGSAYWLAIGAIAVGGVGLVMTRSRRTQP